MSDVGRIVATGAVQNGVIYSGVKTRTVVLDSHDFDDRVINIRFMHKAPRAGAPRKTFTIRSDYEIEYTKTGFQYVPIKQKPDIKISYKQVADDTVIDLNLDVGGLFIKDPSVFEAGGQTIESVEIQLGYRCQLPNWATNPAYTTRKVEDFYALVDDGALQDAGGAILATRIVAQVLTVQRLAMPPQASTRFQCIIGVKEGGLWWNKNDSNISKDFAAMSPAHWYGKKPVNLLPGTFYAMITRRFVNSTRPHDVWEKISHVPVGNGRTHATKEVKSQAVTIYDNHGAVLKRLSLEDGCMKNADADVFGTLVYLSPTLWGHPLEELPLWGLTDDEAAKAEPIVAEPELTMMDKLASQFEQIRKQYPFIRFYALGDGNYYVYHEKEGKDDFFASDKTDQEQKNGIVMLPAVYEIAWGGTRTIRAPFFSLLGSMKTVAFQARYALNDLTGYYYSPDAKNNCFLVLIMDVDFATVGGTNLVTLTCTDIEGQYKPVLLPDGRLIPAVKAPSTLQVARQGLWVRKTLTVVDNDEGLKDTVDNSWQAVVQLMLDSAKQYSGYWGDEAVTVDGVLDKLHEWNSALFSTTRINDHKSQESQTYGRPLSLIFGKESNPITAGEADYIVIRYPYLPDSIYDKPGREIKT